MDAASADLLRALVDALPGRPWLVDDHAPRRAGGLRGARRAAGALAAPAGARPGADARARGGGDRGRAGSAARPRPRRGAVGGQPAVPARPAGQRRRRGRHAARQHRGGGHRPHRPAVRARTARSCAAPSVLGTSFHPRMVADVLEGGEPVDERTWTRLADVFADDGGGWLRFRHGVVRDAAYAGLPFRTRRRLHAIAGERLERELGEAAGERAAILSLHFLLAGDNDRAWTYARAAGDRARDSYAYADAARLYRRALDAAGRRASSRPSSRPPGSTSARRTSARASPTRRWRPSGARATLLPRRSGLGRPRSCTARRSWPTARGDAVRAVRCAERGHPRRSRAPTALRAGACRAALLAALATARLRQGRCEEAVLLCRDGHRGGGGRLARSGRVAHACFVLDWALHDAGRPEEADALGPRAGDLRAPRRPRPPGRRAQQPRRLRLPRGPLAGRRRRSTAAPATRARGRATWSTRPSATATSARCCSARGACLWPSRRCVQARQVWRGTELRLRGGMGHRVARARGGARRTGGGRARGFLQSGARRSTAGCGTTPRRRSPRPASPRR